MQFLVFAVIFYIWIAVGYTVAKIIMNGDPERQAKPSDDGATWWCKLLARGVGIISAISKYFKL